VIQGEQNQESSPPAGVHWKAGIDLLLFFACCGVLLTDFDPKAAADYAGAIWSKTFNELPPEIRRTVCRWARAYRKEAAAVGLKRSSSEASPIVKVAEAILSN
jgi:hypothetical protein